MSVRIEIDAAVGEESRSFAPCSSRTEIEDESFSIAPHSSHVLRSAYGPGEFHATRTDDRKRNGQYMSCLLGPLY